MRAKEIRPESLTRAELEELGFRAWDETGLMLCPKGVFGRLAKGTIMTTINGGTKVVGADGFDLDERHGLLAFGVYPAACR